MIHQFDPESKNEILITCLPGLGEVLADELKTLGFEVSAVKPTSCLTSGNFHDTYKLNYLLRTASHVHYKIMEFQCRNANDLYKQARKFPWERVIEKDGYFSIHSRVKNDSIRDNRFANLKLKDAIADRFLEKTNSRPDSGSDTSEAVFYLHWYGNNARVFLDTSGQSLSRRGYRKDPWKAPMAESLAAAVVLSTQWDRKSTFINPFGGSGTLIIEALLIALDIAPGSFRNSFGFSFIKGFDSRKWIELKSKHKGTSTVDFKVIYNDNKRHAHTAVKRNLESVGLTKHVEFVYGDFKKLEIPPGPGIVIINPPYGERLGEIEELEPLYSEIGDFFKQKCVNYTGYVFTANLDLAKNLGLRTRSRKIFYNARLEARLLEYELYSGSNKKKNEE